MDIISFADMDISMDLGLVYFKYSVSHLETAKYS